MIRKPATPPATTDYRSIADQLTADIQAGRLRPGARLPPQRTFAYKRRIAASTAGRVYGELRRRGLVTGEVGRGTFVRDTHEPADAFLIDLPPTPVNLELVSPILYAHSRLFADALAQLAGSAAFPNALRSVGAIASSDSREIGARFLSRPDWQPQADQVLFTGSGKQALAAALSAVASRGGGRIAVESLTYPVLKTVAAALGVELVPIEMDSDGLSASALEGVLARVQLSGIYIQSSVQSPTGVTMSIERRMAIAALLQRHDIVAIEDGIYHFLTDEPPIATFAPKHVIFVDSMSKRLAPGLALGVIAAPRLWVDKLAAAIRKGVWMPSGLTLSIGIRWMAATTLPQLVATKRSDARERQKIARDALKDFAISGDSRAYHLWLPLPDTWRAEAFASAALRNGIALTPGSAFAVQPGHAPNGVRLALAAPPMDELRGAIEKVRQLALHHEDPIDE